MLSAYVRLGREPEIDVDEVEPAEDPAADAVEDLQEWTSLEELKAQANITQNIRASELSCSLLMDDKHNVYALDTAGTRTVPKYSFVGGFGGGQLVSANLDVTAAIPFTLPQGDKSIVQLQR